MGFILKRIKRQLLRFVRFLRFDFGELHSSQQKQTALINQINNNLQQANDRLLTIEERISVIEERVSIINDMLGGLKWKMDVYSRFYNPELQSLIFTLPREKKNVLVCGYYGAPNLGDELMLQTLLERIDPNTCHVTVMLADSATIDTTIYGNVSILHYSKTKFDYDILASVYDAVIFGGGAVLDEVNYDRYTPYAQELAQVLLGLGKAFTAHEKKVLVIAVSTNHELVNPLFIGDLSYIINNVTYFSLRDKYSVDTLERSNINTDRIHLVRDIIWANSAFMKPAPKHDTHKTSKQIGIIWAHFQEPMHLARDLIVSLAASIKDDYHINFIPFFSESRYDNRFYDDLALCLPEAIRQNTTILEPMWKMTDVIEVFSAQDLIINMRYHGALIAGILDIPCITLWHDEHRHYINKMKYIENEFSQSVNIALSAFDAKEISATAVKLLDDAKERILKRSLIEESMKELDIILSAL